jgi:hypothetical protein
MKTMPFGKYKGQRLDTIPRKYLQWVLKNLSLSTELQVSIETILTVRAFYGWDDEAYWDAYPMGYLPKSDDELLDEVFKKYE